MFYSIILKRILPVTLLISAIIFGWFTYRALHPFPPSLRFSYDAVQRLQILDRQARELTVTYQNFWNLQHFVPLHKIPKALQEAFVFAEDKRFYQHRGVDWLARIHATVQNLKMGKIVRGASTISEQSTRILQPRPRTFWSRWVETFASAQLEQRFSKADILEFYLNQVPYASQRRGVLQAARHYFDRDLDTLNRKEMLALAVLVRSPGRLDLRRGTEEIKKPLQRLAQRMLEAGALNQTEYNEILQQPLNLQEAPPPVQAMHFVQHLSQQFDHKTLLRHAAQGRLRSTLDADIQEKSQALLDRRLKDLEKHGVTNGAILLLDHHSNEVLAWVNGGNLATDVPGSMIDAVTTPRQPGSTLKPFLYALALEKGWTPATLLDDSPLSKTVGSGLHNFRNYSRTYYGSLRLRDALGNSLNVPAVRTINFTGTEAFLSTLHRLGIRNLEQHPDFYGEGLALGNGEISLLELVRAYAAVANLGVYRPLKFLLNQDSGSAEEERVFSAESASLLGNILSDADARQLEFGHGGLLRFPVQTAVKTGTSNDYRDAWAVGFNYRYVAGVWLGNLDRRSMQRITGASGPALVLRSLFAELNRNQDTRPLYLSPALVKREICRDSGLAADGVCASRSEWFIAGNEPQAVRVTKDEILPETPPRLEKPGNGLHLAMDPRIPDEYEVFTLSLKDIPDVAAVDWWMDGELIATTDKAWYDWKISRGSHTLHASVRKHLADMPEDTPAVTFYVH